MDFKLTHAFETSFREKVISQLRTGYTELNDYLHKCYIKKNANCEYGEKETIKVSKGAKIINQVPHLTQDTNGKVTNSQLDITNESQEVSPFPAGDHKAHINRRAQRHSNHKAEKNIKDPQKKYHLGTVSKIFYWRA